MVPVLFNQHLVLPRVENVVPVLFQQKMLIPGVNLVVPVLIQVSLVLAGVKIGENAQKQTKPYLTQVQLLMEHVKNVYLLIVVVDCLEIILHQTKQLYRI